MFSFQQTGLPIEAYLDTIASRLAATGTLVLQAEPGAGKTSLVPLVLAKHFHGHILVMEPRRVAALRAAEYMAELTGTQIGKEIGYAVRGDSRQSTATRILCVTPGVLLALLREDPLLERVGAVILDEFHERSAQADLAFAFLREARRAGAECALLVMSATIDGKAAAQALADTDSEPALLSVPGRSYPVETRYQPLPTGRGFEQALAELAVNLARQIQGDVLAFLPGAAEIARAREAALQLGMDAIALHGSAPLAEQHRAVAPAANAAQRVVFATSIAESSLTVARVRGVVDSGLARLTRYHPGSGLNRLVTERLTRDRADQRRGRAGRLGPGVCIRTWAEHDPLVERAIPEILRSDLSALVLDAAAWGARSRLDLAWLEAPPEAAWQSGVELLQLLGALDDTAGITTAGRDLLKLGTEPRLAAMIIQALDHNRGQAACRLAALLSEDSQSSDCDLAEHLNDFPRLATSRARNEANRLSRAAGLEANAAAASRLDSGSAARTDTGRLLAAAWPDRIARKERGEGMEALFRMATGRVLRVRGRLASAAWIVIADADAGQTEGRVYAAAAISEADALKTLARLSTESVELEWQGLQARARKRRKAGVLVLEEVILPSPSAEDVRTSLMERLHSERLGILPWGHGSGSPQALLERLRWYTQRKQEVSVEKNFTDRFDEHSLINNAEAWLAPWINGGPGDCLDEKMLAQALLGLLDTAERRAFEKEAPASLLLPSGARRPLEYPAGQAPLLEARIQEFYGLDTHPRIMGLPVLLRLLSPAGRPVQTSADLPGFWRGSWKEARKELRGRYPKHDWPEDPASAKPGLSSLKSRRLPT
ncbi:MAG: ATP-dependent helicase HrpB [Spirochaetes bacterium]|nr:ATP-dependent helicase HrpB [Spirochaetota bacterium]